MVKLIALLRSLPQLSRDEVIHYYENHHVPLMLSVMPGIVDYRRNYLEDAVDGCDIITELWFENQDSMDRAMAAISEPGVAQRIAEDESHFLDRRGNRAVFVSREEGGPVKC